MSPWMVILNMFLKSKTIFLKNEANKLDIINLKFRNLNNKILSMMFTKDTLASALVPELNEQGSTLGFSPSSGLYNLPLTTLHKIYKSPPKEKNLLIPLTPLYFYPDHKSL